MGGKQNFHKLWNHITVLVRNLKGYFNHKVKVNVNIADMAVGLKWSNSKMTWTAAGLETLAL